jgi:hypothetical protein
MNERRWIIDRIGEDAFEQLAARLAASDLHSVLLEAMERRADARTPNDVLQQYARDRFCEPGLVDLRAILDVDRELLGAALAFDAIELSPVAPLGATAVMGRTTQHRVLSALRLTEVVSDPTNVMALECASRLRRTPTQPVHLATAMRVLRTQPVPKAPGHSQHFRMFALASAGFETADHGFTVETLALHIGSLLDGFDRLEKEGYAFGRRRVQILTTGERLAVGERLARQLGPIATVDALDHPYYSGGVRYKIWVTAANGAQVPLVDGGTFDWMARLLSNRRAVFVATGAGSQLMPLMFRAQDAV